WRLALRRQLLAPNAWSTLASAQLSSAAREELASIALAVPSAEAAAFLLEYIRRQGLQSTQAEAQLAHLCQHLPLEQQSSLIQLVRGHASGDVPLQLRLLPVLHQRSRERGREQVPELEAWASELAGHIFATTKAGADGWRVISGTNTWGLERRASQDGQRDGSFLSSLPGGERSVGVLRSRRFTVPTQLSFYICGHLGVPNQPANERNYVRLCLADTGEEVVRTLPPRNDTARHVTWQLERYAGQDGYLEIVDGLDLSAYAWLAVARFSPEVVELPAISLVQRGQYQAAACGLVESLRLASLQPQVAELLRDDTVDWGVRAAAAQAWLAFQPRPFMSALARLLGDAAWDAQARDKVLTRVIGSDQDADLAQLGEAMKGASTRLQRQLADALAATPVGATHLVTLMERGQVTSRLLQDPAIKQKLAAAGDAAANERAERLLASLSPLNLELLQLIEQRRRFYAADKASGPRGQEVFRKHCATCHQVAGQGTLIAPQLDGIGQRGLERVIEDVLDPNRNIDETFHLSVIQLVNGRVATGLLRREEGGNLVLANQEGKEFVVAKADMEEHTRARVSLMPANFGELLKADEFDDLVAYLLSLRAR
ncbi:MAG: c-type cytochrome, partial [Pirellulaceae bacterium]